jgi:hypothetical protein
MRPSNKVAPVEEMLARFLRQLQPYEAAIEPAVNGFFATLREIMMLINPLALRDAVAAVYETIRQKVRVLDPVQLTTAIEAVLAPVQESLQALNPASIKAQIDAVFENAVRAVTVTVRGFLDELVGVVDGQLRTLRAALRFVLDQIKGALTAALATLRVILKQIEDLVFVEILDRLDRVIDNLGVSFEAELDRVRGAFDEMLRAIPLGDGSASAGVAL